MNFQEAADYRSVAGSVHTRLVDARLNHGRPSQPLSRSTERRFDVIKRLLQVSAQFSGGSLEQARNVTPEKMTLAEQLAELAPKKVAEFRDQEEFDMEAWSKKAVEILDSLREEERLSTDESEAEFTQVELEGFLKNLRALPRGKPKRFVRLRNG